MGAVSSATARPWFGATPQVEESPVTRAGERTVHPVVFHYSAHRQAAVPSENLICPLSGRTTLVPMVQSPDLGERDDLSAISAVDRAHPSRALELWLLL